jgi:hypothetical protein
LASDVCLVQHANALTACAAILLPRLIEQLSFERFRLRRADEIPGLSRNRFASCLLVGMQTFETTDAKVARRCRYHQHRGKKTTVTVEGALVTGLVRSVMEVRSSSPKRWIVTVIARPSIAA